MGIVLICAETGNYPDDVPGECNECGKKIVYRPHAPKDVLRLCLGCGLSEMVAARMRGEPVNMGVTAKTLEEVAAWKARN